MTKRLKVALLYGGRSGEHEVSLCSAASVLTHLDQDKFEIIPIGLDKTGRCFVNRFEELKQYDKALPVQTDESEHLPSLIRDGRFAVDADVVFPVVHGPLYEDGALQGILEFADIPYVGCGVLASSIGMDKDMTRRIVCQEEVVSTQYCTISWHAKSQEVEQCAKRAAESWGFPLFVKPCSLGSSVGIHKANNMSELLEAISDAKRYDALVMIEAAVVGREIELAVLENTSITDAPLVSLPGEIEILHEDGFYSYTAKYLESDKSPLHIPANLEAGLVSRLQKMAQDIFVRMRCRGMARVDFFVNDQTQAIYFNEINTIPGFTAISMYPKLWEVSGIAYKDLLTRLIDLACIHHQCRKQLVTHYQ